jgi:hypothetical protein
MNDTEQNPHSAVPEAPPATISNANGLGAQVPTPAPPARGKKCKTGQRRAIQWYCQDCRDPGAYRYCPNTKCALWPLRLSGRKLGPIQPLVAIHKFCLFCTGNTRYSPEHVRNCDGNYGHESSRCPLWPYRMGHGLKRTGDPGRPAVAGGDRL